MPGATCWGLGDPHYKSFDGRRFDFYGKGEFWLVKNRRLAIQSRLEQLPSNAAISFHSGVAFAGEALQGTTVEVLGAAGGLRAQLALGRIRPFLCANLCVPPSHSRPNKPPSVQIKINGSAYSDGVKVKNVNIVPTGAPGSYSKSAIPLPPAQLVAGFPFTVQSALA